MFCPFIFFSKEITDLLQHTFSCFLQRESPHLYGISYNLSVLNNLTIQTKVLLTLEMFPSINFSNVKVLFKCIVENYLECLVNSIKLLVLLV